MLVAAPSANADKHMLDLAKPLEGFFRHFDLYRRNTTMMKQFWRLFESQSAARIEIRTPAGVIKAAKAFYPDHPALEKADAQLLLGQVLPPLALIAGLARRFDQEWPGVGENWLNTLLEEMPKWPTPSAQPGSPAEQTQYTNLLGGHATELAIKLGELLQKSRRPLSSNGTTMRGQTGRQSQQQVSRNVVAKNLQAKTAGLAPRTAPDPANDPMGYLLYYGKENPDTLGHWLLVYAGRQGLLDEMKELVKGTYRGGGRNFYREWGMHLPPALKLLGLTAEKAADELITGYLPPLALK